MIVSPIPQQLLDASGQATPAFLALLNDLSRAAQLTCSASATAPTTGLFVGLTYYDTVLAVYRVLTSTSPVTWVTVGP
jgi:hypothetical protein